ncbi:MAG TPA: hypothetical protein VFK68_03630 [Propionibacteriaceae bacterium]|nr:hypothetical protein [Propionibacteriaceae bacterium]
MNPRSAPVSYTRTRCSSTGLPPAEERFAYGLDLLLDGIEARIRVAGRP